MKAQRILLFLLLILVTLAACSPGHFGNDVIGFIRDGHLWTIDPDGANAFAIATDGPAVVGYNWSPNHQIVTFRALDADFATTSAAKHLVSNAISGQVADLPSVLNAIGVDGGTPIPIAFSNSSIRYSNPIWNAAGTRLLYRQTGMANLASPAEASWVIAQSDQPGGIAAKTFPSTYTIPSFSYTTQKLAGVSASGLFTTTLAGTNMSILAPPPDNPLPAPQERILWQPAHQDAALLYAIRVSSLTRSNTTTSQIQLMLRASNGRTTSLVTCSCTQFAWAPDGNHLLYTTGTSYTVMDINTTSSFTIAAEEGSIPYWSPDSKFLLLDGAHTLLLIQIAQQRSSTLLRNSNAQSGTTFPFTPTASTLMQPVANSIWAADSRHFLFLTHDRLQWQGNIFNAGKQGLYVATIDDSGQTQGTPTVVDTGNDTQAGWTYQDANTSFLY